MESKETKTEENVANTKTDETPAETDASSETSNETKTVDNTE